MEDRSLGETKGEMERRLAKHIIFGMKVEIGEGKKEKRVRKRGMKITITTLTCLNSRNTQVRAPTCTSHVITDYTLVQVYIILYTVYSKIRKLEN